MSTLSQAKHLCPLVKEEHTECYFMKMTSSDIQKTVLYCIDNFESCEIFKRFAAIRQEA
ncbi:hypothetical protein Pcar_3223 [Syntrophotalea carbinolica DSM 2380]|uniref:Uncharacterized protein n=1 Tax=Syntrophotalea carbinolica (strain DSM 2380 / NBRC 103641 / GraBd1) TaxID=338963 RepID=Q0C6U4_SYNC1|nr:hypothetical protein Pcar_3223 [Syntrophotalea carbinolica DSM 2380]